MTRTGLILLIALGSSLIFSLFHMSYMIDQQSRQLNILNAELRQVEKNISILETEWSYLSRPERLSALAAKYLQLESPEAVQVASFVSLSENLNLDDEAFAKLQASYGE